MTTIVMIMKSFVAFKVETEAEGATWNFIRDLKSFSNSKNMELFAKVGGVEAKTDLALLRELEIQGAIAPMVESGFGVTKFHSATENLGFKWRALTLETETAVTSNLSDILAAAKDLGINGITIGRGDLADSMGLKRQEDSPKVMEVVRRVAYEAKQAGLLVTVGGKMELKSLSYMGDVLDLADRIETRRVVVPIQKSISETKTWLTDAIEVEKLLEENKLFKLEQETNLVKKRIGELTARLEN